MAKGRRPLIAAPGAQKACELAPLDLNEALEVIGRKSATRHSSPSRVKRGFDSKQGQNVQPSAQHLHPTTWKTLMLGKERKEITRLSS